MSLSQLHFGVGSCEVAIIRPDIYILPRTFGQNGIWNFIELEVSTERWKTWIIDKQRGGLTPISNFHLKFILLVFLFRLLGLDFTSIKLDFLVRIVSPFEAAQC